MLFDLLNDIISPNQTATVPGRNIAENVLLAHEIVKNYSTIENKAKKGVPSRWKIGKLMIQWKIWNSSLPFSAFKL